MLSYIFISIKIQRNREATEGDIQELVELPPTLSVLYASYLKRNDLHIMWLSYSFQVHSSCGKPKDTLEACSLNCRSLIGGLVDRDLMCISSCTSLIN